MSEQTNYLYTEWWKIHSNKKKIVGQKYTITWQMNRRDSKSYVFGEKSWHTLGNLLGYERTRDEL